MNHLPLKIALMTLLLMTGCNRKYVLNEEQKRLPLTNEFSDYWFQGKAELTSYDLSQARYGELHEGHAVLIFVTEDFSFSKHVKLDRPQQNPEDALKVMKLNFTKKFNTGIYPYSIMQSIFTPLNTEQFPYSLKISSSSQEWCGHTYSNMNLEDDDYLYTGESYFESEVSTRSNLKKVMVEDEVWTRLRLDPSRLPVGEFEIIPSPIFSRLRHADLDVQNASAALEEQVIDSLGAVMTYTLKYAAIPRTLSINFEKDFPYEIISWEETQRSGFGPNAKELTTKGVRKKTVLLDYWAKNAVQDSIYRRQLDLP